MKLNKDDIKKVISFACYDEADYKILVESVNGSKFSGLVLYMDSAYPSATYPRSILPQVNKMEFDLSDTDRFVEDSFRLRDATNAELHYEEDALRQQKKFLARSTSDKEGIVCQSAVFDIVRRRDDANVKTFVICDSEMTNAEFTFNENTAVSAYVTQQKWCTDTLEDMNEFYNSRTSTQCSFASDTLVTYNITDECDLEHIRTICRVTIPYAILKEKGFKVFPVELEQDLCDSIQNTIKFMNSHEYTKGGN